MPISDALRQRIERWDNNCFLEIAEHSNQWWEDHYKEENEIAYALQNELPNSIVRRYYHTDFIELDKIAYNIEIMNGFEKGANFWIFPTIETNMEAFYQLKREEENGITLDEDFSFPYIKFFIDPYFEPSIQERDWQYFDWWGENYYTYDSIEKVLGDMRGTIHLLLNHYDSLQLTNWKASIKELRFDYLFLNKFYPEIDWRALNDAEQNQFIKTHRYIFIDFYIRFIAKMEEIMKNAPECKFICFNGP